MAPLPLIHTHLTGNATITTPESTGWDRDEYLGQLVPFICEALLVLLVIVYVVGRALRQYSARALLILEAVWLIENYSSVLLDEKKIERFLFFPRMLLKVKRAFIPKKKNEVA